jgi:hydroxymethylpyrimidine pyrophosphatase-like HAD family hydrolase
MQLHKHQCMFFFVTHNDKEVFEGLIKYSVSAGEECKEIKNSKHGVLTTLIAPEQLSSFA